MSNKKKLKPAAGQRKLPGEAEIRAELREMAAALALENPQFDRSEIRAAIGMALVEMKRLADVHGTAEDQREVELIIGLVNRMTPTELFTIV